MKLIVGLGNPGKEYDKTRHNIGFNILDIIADKYNLSFNENKKFNALEVIFNLMNEKLKETIKQNNLINNKDIKELYKNEIIHKYVENQNILDLHIYYLNKEIKKLMEQL